MCNKFEIISLVKYQTSAFLRETGTCLVYKRVRTVHAAVHDIEGKCVKLERKSQNKVSVNSRITKNNGRRPKTNPQPLLLNLSNYQR